MSPVETARHPRPLPPAWSRRRWGLTLSAILVGQVGLVFFLSRPVPPSPANGSDRGQVDLVAGTAFETQFHAQPWLADPAQFALVSPSGFSGPAWLRRPQFEPGPLAWTEPYRWLTPEVARLGLPAAHASAGVADPIVARREPGERPFAPRPPPPALTNSALRLEGDLTGRRLLVAPPTPSWPHNDILLPTTVQIVVRRDGTVLSATLLTRSGLPEADARALEGSRQARFEADPSPELVPPLRWGRFVFLWHTTELPATPNPAPAAPPRRS